MVSALLLFSCGNSNSRYEQIHERNDNVSSKSQGDSEAKLLVNNLLDEDDS